MAMRMTGLVSGMDTESLVAQLMEAHQTKVDDVKKDKQVVQWKTEAWQSLNTKISAFYNTQVSALRTNGSYKTNKVTSNNSAAVSVSAGNNVSRGTHIMSVKQLASAAYLTGASIKNRNQEYSSVATAKDTTKFDDMTDSSGQSLGVTGKEISISYNSGKNTGTVTFTLGGSEENSVASLKELNEKISQDENLKGLTAKYDANGQIVFSNASISKDENGDFVKGTDFTISSEALGLDSAALNAKESEKAEATTTSGTTGLNYSYTFNSSEISGTTKLADIGIAVGSTFSINGKDFVVDSSTTIDGLTDGLSKLGVKASFDAKQGRFYINSSGSGTENNFKITGDLANLAILGLDSASATKIDAQDAIIEYNGVEYKSDSNVFKINDMVITAQQVTYEVDAAGNVIKNNPVTLTVESDTEGIYNKIKNFVKGYNELIDEMNKLYNEAKPQYEPLTEAEKAEMSDDQIEQWEKQAKTGLLRRDSTISSLLSSMRSILNKAVTVTNADGTTSNYTLSSLGIVTGDYSENGKLHILGDADDPLYADKDNKLKKMIESSPDIFAQVFAGSKENQGIGYQLYDKLTTSMKRITGVSSSLTFYTDLTYKSQISDYDDKIKTLQEKFAKMEDRYYSQFSAMETAMAKIQSQQSYLSQLGLGS